MDCVACCAPWRWCCPMSGQVVSQDVFDEVKRRILASYAAADARGLEPEEFAQMVGAPLELVQLVLSSSGFSDELQGRVLRARMSGETLRHQAVGVSARLLDTIDKALDDDQVDPAEAATMLPKVFKVVEHADRMDASRGTANRYPTVHVDLSGGRVRVRLMDDAEVDAVKNGGPIRSQRAEVVDAEVVEAKGGGNA